MLTKCEEGEACAPGGRGGGGVMRKRFYEVISNSKNLDYVNSRLNSTKPVTKPRQRRLHRPEQLWTRMMASLRGKKLCAAAPPYSPPSACVYVCVCVSACLSASDWLSNCVGLSVVCLSSVCLSLSVRAPGIPCTYSFARRCLLPRIPCTGSFACRARRCLLPRIPGSRFFAARARR